MIIQVINKYLILSDSNITKPILCGLEPEHGRLYGSMDDKDSISLNCLACNYKMSPGIELYQKIEKILHSLEK